MYHTGDVVAEYQIMIKYSDEQAIDDGCVQKDMYSAFWEEAYCHSTLKVLLVLFLWFIHKWT